MPAAATQLSLPFAQPARCIPSKRRYCRHQRKHVVWLRLNYHVYTRTEAAAYLGLTVKAVDYLCGLDGIRKRAPNGSGRRSGWQKIGNNPALGLAA